jgi:TonB family protein
VARPVYPERIFEVGFVLSLILHAIITALFNSGYFTINDSYGAPKIYSVTIEGGKVLGGKQQVPDESKKSQVAPLKQVQDPIAKPEKIEPEKEPVKENKKVEAPQDAEVSTAEHKKDEKKLDKKIEKVEEKKKIKPDPKEKEKPKKNEKSEIDKKLQQAMQRYLGESTQAGGKGFGAGALGGNGMGGGILKSKEYIAYSKLLEDRVKGSWSWPDRKSGIFATVSFNLSQTGEISNVKIEKSSGVREFDDSVVRATMKASPVPPPPYSIANEFRTVSVIFDPKDL